MYTGVASYIDLVSEDHLFMLKQEKPELWWLCCLVCHPRPCCLSPVHAEEEPPVQPAEGGHGVVHGEPQHLRQQ